MPSVLHISYELRDRKNRKTTKAVRNLIDTTKAFSEPVVVDLMRVSRLREEIIEIDSRNHLVINALGLPYSLFLRTHLKRIYDFILTAEQRNLIDLKNTEIIHAHKVTFEGYIGYKLHQRLNVPLILTLRNTDFTVFRFRPDLHPLFRRILKSAYKVVYLVPSMLSLLKKSLGTSFFNEHLKHKMVHIPNIIIRNSEYSEFGYEEPYFFTAFSLTRKDIKGKNLMNLLKAIAEIKHLNVKLKIAGAGDYVDTVRQWINNLHLSDKVELLGRIPNQNMDKYYASATAFVLPSLSESFGMVYAEALLNGTPILCSRGVLGFEGFFNNVGVAVDPHSVEDISKGLIELITNNTYYRNEISKLRNSGAFNVFNPENVENIYKEMISGALPLKQNEMTV